MNQNLTFVIISTHNDLSIRKTLNSISSVGKILLIDGGPRRNSEYFGAETVCLKELALQHSATYLQRNYDYSSAQYNFGLSNVETEWAFIIDSDEVVSNPLAEWLKAGDFEKKDFYSVKRINYFLNKRVSHGQFKPDWNIRLLKTGLCQYEDRKVHARMKVNGIGGKAPSFMEHRTVQSIDAFVLKMLAFSKLEKDSRSMSYPSNELKSYVRFFMQKLPFQASLRFIYSFWFRLGVLDGRIGYLLARSASYYEILVSLNEFNSDE
jgi:hypothetical protein